MHVLRRAEEENEVGYHYYVWFKPAMPSEEDVHQRVPVEAALSVSETGDLADLSFVLPKPFRTEEALSFIRHQQGASYDAPRVRVPVPGRSGDAIARAAANLEVDLAGRIIAMEIHWVPFDGGGEA